MLAAGLLIAAAAPNAAAQMPPRQPTPNDTLVSPEPLPDHRVVFRIYAPKASEVTLSGDMQATYEPVKLEKDDTGAWSATVGPLRPDYYSYSFTVDGVRTLDPKNALIKQGVSSLDNMFLVPGAEAAFEENRTVPHGEIRQAWYQSSTLNMQRRMHIYTPPGYDAGKDRYPVFYLLHGGGDEDSGWSTIGRAGFILDNLIAERKAKPMIVVMPNGSLPMPANLPRFVPGTTPSPEFMAAMVAAQARFTSELTADVIPFVEKNYRTVANPQNRALAGLSMGGGQTLASLIASPDKFSYVAIWSAGINLQRYPDFEQKNAPFLDSAGKLNQQLKLLSIRVGDKDFALEGSKSLAELLKKKGINHELNIGGGGHTWLNWRQYLDELAPRLFK
jgi:enterochelin esterase family protein